MQSVKSLLPQNPRIFGGPEAINITKAVDLRRQSIEFAWTRGVGLSIASTSHVLWTQPQRTLEKARFKVAWEGINYQTVSSKAQPWTPFLWSRRPRHGTNLPIGAIPDMAQTRTPRHTLESF